MKFTCSHCNLNISCILIYYLLTKLLFIYLECHFTFTTQIVKNAKILTFCNKWGKQLVTHKTQGISPSGFLPESGTFQRSKQSNFLLLLWLFLTLSIMASRSHFYVEREFWNYQTKGFTPRLWNAYPQVYKVNLRKTESG